MKQKIVDNPVIGDIRDNIARPAKVRYGVCR